MKTHNISIGMCITIFVLLSIMGVSRANAMYVFNDPERPEESGKAATIVYRALSDFFKSLEALERGDLNTVRLTKSKMLESLGKTISLYENMEARIKEEPIDIRKIPPGELQTIRADFARIRIDFPKSTKGLARIATQEITHFMDSLEKITFTEVPAENRKLIKLINNEIWLLLLSGVSVSELWSWIRN